MCQCRGGASGPPNNAFNCIRIQENHRPGVSMTYTCDDERHLSSHEVFPYTLCVHGIPCPSRIKKYGNQLNETTTRWGYLQGLRQWYAISFAFHVKPSTFLAGPFIRRPFALSAPDLTPAKTQTPNSMR